MFDVYLMIYMRMLCYWNGIRFAIPLGSGEPITTALAVLVLKVTQPHLITYNQCFVYI